MHGGGTVEASHFKPLEVFFRFDVDGNGRMDVHEFEGAIGAMGLAIPPELIHVAFKELDENGAIPFACVRVCARVSSDGCKWLPWQTTVGLRSRR